MGSRGAALGKVHLMATLEMRTMVEIALITGASSGLGVGIAKVLASKGVIVVLVARRQERLSEVAATINNSGGKAFFKQVDVTDKTQVAALGSWVKKEIGLPTILVNNSGSNHNQLEFADISSDVWEPLLDLNVKAGLYMISGFLADMRKVKKGHVVNISSIAGRDPVRGYAVYSGTKFFWTGASESMRKELAGTGVKVTNVLPGVCDTELFRTEAKESLGMTEDQIAEVAPKAIQPEDIGEVVWEAVGRPERCYVKDIFITDMVFSNAAINPID